jgi:hypothetical protein
MAYIIKQIKITDAQFQAESDGKYNVNAGFEVEFLSSGDMPVDFVLLWYENTVLKNTFP